ncbi:hypothetical protein B0I35DRAFT_430138 [Stachybotrys elegans]|uniref:Large ribosomal subunit protein uL23m n=1 Tax=Stachybotrys elegans TaxID=80388 RepID=A0A8K0SSP4_9HYPO|nr:hypothetical protein B0I35DRAFT_430138 [Stachybotrys elegans]
MQALQAAEAAVRPAFRLGQKQIHLPNHVITFINKPKLPPTEAYFKVPLTFTKFDIRDYLWNLYGVEVKKVRVQVLSQPLRRRTPISQSHYRPKPLKYMTVELCEPFQWPEAPSDLSPWQNEMWQMREEKRLEQSQAQVDKARSVIPMRSKQPLSEERKKLSELAQQLLRGEATWSNDKPLDPKFDKLVGREAGDGKA